MIFTAPSSGASVITITQSISIAGNSASANETANSTPGSYQVSASASGANSVDFDLTNDKMNTSTELTSSPNPSEVGQTVLFTAAVSASQGEPTGTVTFYDDDTLLGSELVDGSGQATFSISTLAAGTHSTITAQYDGDINFMGSTSDDYSQAVDKADTTTDVGSIPNVSVYGQFVTLTASIYFNDIGAAAPTGLVTFYDDGVLLGSELVHYNELVRDSSQAAFAISTLAVGEHSMITAQYSGDDNFTGSTSINTTLTVNRAETTTVLTSTPNVSVFGQSVTFTATVSIGEPGAGTPTGTVDFYDDGTFLGSGSMEASGVATLMISSLAPGSHSITAQYRGDTNFDISTSSVNVHSVWNTTYIPFVVR